ncbi:hypothetical protein QFZ77_002455 [Paenibacillus sp. V4I3]|uniref:hypothetical protein n=1 Tax=Paenibacillus sp. V4I3 TaxID=3042305 RepID=UPI002788A03D|nr:hypothetical protein [Paenibacillus sp. V4I3]MDQ0873796.1 hypothetical protein [Paenibacillus sp. V4I3]
MATPGPINRTLLQSFYQNAGDVYDDTKTEGAFGTLADQVDANYDYTSGLVAGGVLQPYPAFLSRQALINGNFDVWQRGTSFTGGVYSADRWVAVVTAPSDNTVTRQSFTSGQTEVPNNPQYFLRFSPTVNQAAGSNVRQRIEGVKTLSGNTVTLSVWLRSSVPISATLLIRQNFGTGGSPSASVDFSTNVSVTTLWQRFTLTATLGSISGKTLGTNNNDCLEIIFITNLANTAHYFDVAQVQVNTGNQALPFQPKSVAEELTLCQRYYEKSYDYLVAPLTTSGAGIEKKVVPSNTIASFQPYGKTSFKVVKRIIPTITVYPFTTPTNTGRVSDSNGVDLAAASGATTNIGTGGFDVFNNAASQTTVNQVVIYHWTADSEI